MSRAAGQPGAPLGSFPVARCAEPRRPSVEMRRVLVSGLMVDHVIGNGRDAAREKPDQFLILGHLPQRGDEPRHPGVPCGLSDLDVAMTIAEKGLSVAFAVKLRPPEHLHEKAVLFVPADGEIGREQGRQDGICEDRVVEVFHPSLHGGVAAEAFEDGCGVNRRHRHIPAVRDGAPGVARRVSFSLQHNPVRATIGPVWRTGLAGALGFLLIALTALAVGVRPASAQEEVKYRWEPQFYGVLEDRTVLLHSGSFTFSKLTFGDIDGDGDADLLVGKADGRIALFENQGTAKAPRWKLTREAITATYPALAEPGGSGAAIHEITAGARAAPALVDIDGDGDLDLFVGTAEGGLAFYRNVGNPLLPSFVLESQQFVSTRFGKNLVPVFADVNGDRAMDLILGNSRGEVWLLINQGNQKRAQFCVEFAHPDALPDEAPPCLPAPKLIAKISPETDAAPSLDDWDGDGDLDLFVGKSNGMIAYYENRGSKFKPDWRLVQQRFLALKSGGFAAPAFIDINQDGQPDLLVGNSTNGVYAYTGKERVNVLDIYQISANYLDLMRVSGGAERVAVTAGDLDGDKDLDLIIGDRSGRLMFVENKGTPQAPKWAVRNPDILPDPARADATPHLVDIDGDGTLDLLVGDRNGQIHFIKNHGTPRAPQWALETAQLANIDVGSNSVPVTYDIDGDGDLDLFVGNSKGLVIFFRNLGTKNKPEFVLASTRFGEITVSGNAAPAFFDWNGDNHADLLVGDKEGLLHLAVNRSEAGEPIPRRWQALGTFPAQFRSDGFAVPLFADLNGDGKPDLLVGDSTGNLRLLMNGGFTRASAPTQAVAPAAGTPQITEEATATAQPPAPGGAAGAAASPLAELEEHGAAEQKDLALPAAPRGPMPPVFAEPNKEYGGWKFDGKAVPAFADIDGDGDLDLVVGTAGGKLIFFRNDGTRKEAKWTKVTEKFLDYDGGRMAAPYFADVDGDGKVDLLVGMENGTVRYYRGTGQAEGGGFTRMADLVPAGQGGRNASPSVVDLNGDGKLDLLVGTFSGHLMSFNRTGKLGTVEFALSNRRFMGLDAGVSSTPFVGDLDNDGVPDLIVGSDQGNLLIFKKVAPGPKNEWGWDKGGDYFKGIKFPQGSTPRLADIDGDGDEDLFVGTESGKLYFYANQASQQGATESQ